MRVIQAFTLQRTGPDAMSGILDWILTPYYFKKAYPNVPLVLYTNEKSKEALGELWEVIVAGYDEVYTNLLKDTLGIFSAPKFEAMQYELDNFGPDFIIIDNDTYVFDGFLNNIPDYCVYYMEPHLMDWYNRIIAGQVDRLEAPSWMTWTAIPANCSTLRLNNKELLQEYIDLFYSIKAENLVEHSGLEVAIVKEQWSLMELYQREKIVPNCLLARNNSFHKGLLKMEMPPIQVIILQEYLAAWLTPKAFKVYKKIYGDYKIKGRADYDVDSTLSVLPRTAYKGLMAPVFEKANKLKKS